MSKTSPKLTRCKIRLGKDLNWWVTETNDKINWDIDGLSVIDPRQAAHMIETIDGLREYGLDSDVVEKAFITFSIEEKVGKTDLKIIRADESVFEADDQQLFLLPDILDDERSTYAEFLDHITKLQVKMLNDTFKFEKDIVIEDLEDEIRDSNSNDYMEGRALHVFHEVMDILEYVPEGYSLEDDDDDAKKDDEEEDYDIEGIPEDEEENIEEDDTMHWDDDEDDEDSYEDKDESDDEEDSDDDDDDDGYRRRR